MRLISVIENREVAEKILRHLGLPTRAPPRGRPWRAGLKSLDLSDNSGVFDGIDPIPFD